MADSRDEVTASKVLDVFFEEMERRHWSTSTDDVNAAHAATLARFP